MPYLGSKHNLLAQELSAARETSYLLPPSLPPSRQRLVGSFVVWLNVLYMQNNAVRHNNKSLSHALHDLQSDTLTCGWLLSKHYGEEKMERKWKENGKAREEKEKRRGLVGEKAQCNWAVESTHAVDAPHVERVIPSHDVPQHDTPRFHEPSLDWIQYRAHHYFRNLETNSERVRLFVWIIGKKLYFWILTNKSWK